MRNEKFAAQDRVVRRWNQHTLSQWRRVADRSAGNWQRKRLEYPDLKRAVREQYERFRPNVVLLDLDLGDGTAAEDNVAAIRAAGPEVLVLSASDRPPAVRAAIRAGARGYALKNEHADTIRSVPWYGVKRCLSRTRLRDLPPPRAFMSS